MFESLNVQCLYFARTVSEGTKEPVNPRPRITRLGGEELRLKGWKFAF